MEVMKLGESLWKMHLEHMRALDYLLEKSSTRGEGGVLLYLYHIGHPMYPGELTEKLGLTTGRIANILRVLESEGLILRTPDATDKRRVLVALTPRGEVRARLRNQEAVAFHARLISHLEPDEAQMFLDTLMRMIEVMDEDLRSSQGAPVSK